MGIEAIRQRWKHGSGEVLKSILAALLVLAIGAFIYAAYSRYAARQASSGEVSGDNQVPPSRGESARTPGHTEPAAAPDGTSENTNPTSQSAPGAAGALKPPPADTIAPEPPNGMAFAGKGHFQVYRQGDITWRLNTETGATCILFATDAEWRQPRVRRAACNREHR